MIRRDCVNYVAEKGEYGEHCILCGHLYCEEPCGNEDDDWTPECHAFRCLEGTEHVKRIHDIDENHIYLDWRPRNTININTGSYGVTLNKKQAAEVANALLDFVCSSTKAGK